ncbi:WD40 repeat domain-containing protein [Streptomyces sp. NPDC020731]|uniref:WD40 repeat domain-containing protein n=1 Tax=Streptomyces sp. NPDC020731 TaxID=3365085 RepID=UPI0037B740AA
MKGSKMRQLVGLEIASISSGVGQVVGPLLGHAPGGQSLLFAAVQDGSQVGRWDIDTGEMIWCDGEGVPGCNDQVLVPVPGEGLLLAVATESGIEWWDALTGQYRPDMTWDGWTVWALSAGTSPDGRSMLFGAGHNGVVYRWDGTTGELLGTSPEREEPGSMMAVAFVPLLDSQGIVVSGDDAGRIWCWDPVTGDQIGEPILAHASPVRIIQALPTEDPLFVSSDQAGVLQRWRATTDVPVVPVGAPIECGTEVYALTTAKVGEVAVLFAAGADEAVRVWDAETGEPIKFSNRSIVVSALTGSNDAAFLATSTTRGDIIVHKCVFC